MIDPIQSLMDRCESLEADACAIIHALPPDSPAAVAEAKARIVLIALLADLARAALASRRPGDSLIDAAMRVLYARAYCVKHDNPVESQRLRSVIQRECPWIKKAVDATQMLRAIEVDLRRGEGPDGYSGLVRHAYEIPLVRAALSDIETENYPRLVAAHDIWHLRQLERK
jgi:hypothetical protein